MSKELKEKLEKIIAEHGSELGEKANSLSAVAESIGLAKNDEFVFSDYLTDVLKSDNSKFKHTYIPGVTPSDDEFEYRRDIGIMPAHEDIRKQYSLPNLPGTQRKDFSPTKSELTAINKLTGRPYSKEELKVYPIVFWDSEYDSHLERFSMKATREGKRLAPGVPGIKDHDAWKSDNVFAKTFDSEVHVVDGKHYLTGKVYMLNTPENKSIIDGFESNINCEISVGVRGKRDEYICDVCERPMYKFSADPKDVWCGHYVGQRLPGNKVVTATIDGVSAFKEWSRVVRGAQRSARIRVKTDADDNSNSDQLDKSDLTSTLSANSGSEEIEVDEILKMLKQIQEHQENLETKIEKKIEEITESVAELKKEKSSVDAQPQDPPAQPAAPTDVPAQPAAPVVTKADASAPVQTPVQPAQPSAEQIIAKAGEEFEAHKKLYEDRVKLLEDTQSVNLAMTTALQKQNESIMGQMDVMAKAFTALTQQCGELVKTSQDAITADLANFRSEKMRATEREAELAKKDGGVGAAISGFVGALAQHGDKK